MSKSCPFCGSVNVEAGNFFREWTVSCSDCYTEGPVADSEQEAWEKWNIRKNKEAGDVINHPAHYTKYKTEVIDITRYLPFCLGNVVKYVLRAPYKGGVEDCDKALQYMQWCSFTPIQGTMREMTKLRENIDALCAEMQKNDMIEAWQHCFLVGLIAVLDGGFHEKMIGPIKQLRQLLEEKAE